MADQETTDELLLEIDQALESDEEELPEPTAEDREADEVTDWADGPSNEISTSVTYDDSIGDDAAHDESDDVLDLSGLAVEETSDTDDDFPVPAFGEDAPEVEAEGEPDDQFEDADDAVVSRLSSLIQSGPQSDDEDFGDEYDFDDEQEGAGDGYSPLAALTGQGIAPASDEGSPLLKKKKAMALPDPASDEDEGAVENAPTAEEYADTDDDDWSDEDVVAPAVETGPSAEQDANPVSDLDALADALEMSAEEGGLHDCLADARELAQAATASEDRSRAALYAAVGRAYDVALAAAETPDEFAELVEENGLTMQERAPMTPVVKLVFGASYDKTRLTEYAAVLSHAQRVGIERGCLSDFLSEAEGGLKGVVQAERRIRREEAGKEIEPLDEVRKALAKKLRELDAMLPDAFEKDGPEFGLALFRRDADGKVELLGEVSDDIPLVEKVARKLIG